MEKYNVEDTSLLSGGGEYETQDGFGWTNGVALGFKALLEQMETDWQIKQAANRRQHLNNNPFHSEKFLGFGESLRLIQEVLDSNLNWTIIYNYGKVTAFYTGHFGFH